jgi:hypothetical protein
MIVYINNTEINIFKGARIRDAILAYSLHTLKMVQTGKLSIFDRFGNLTEPDGPLIEGQRLTLKRKTQQ